MKKIFFTFLTVLLATLAAQAATDYGFSVAGTTVTSNNCNNITNSYITSGTVYYTPSTNTLYMNNVTISMTGDYNRVINNLDCSGLKVEFSGTCNLYARDAAVVRIRKNTTLYAPSASTVVNITGVYENGIWMATSNSFSLTIQGPGTFNIKSTNNTAIEDENDGSGSQADTWHEVYFDNVNAVLSSGGNSVVKRVLLRFKAGSSVRFKATNNTSYPVIDYCGWQLYGNEALLEPYGAYYSNNTINDSSGNSVYNQDVYVSDDYVAIINATNFPDANFRNYLLGLYPKCYITQTDVNNCTTMNVSGKSISNLQGIKYFTALKELRCYNNPMTSLDVSGLTALTYLDCSHPNTYTGTKLTSLNVSGCTNLETLYCSSNNISSLSVSDFTNLKNLDCSYNTSLTTLNCYRNNLTTLNVAGCYALKELLCFENANLAAITGLIHCTAITYLDCEDCAITSLTAVKNMGNIATLLARNNKLTSLEVTNKSKLKTLRVSGNTTLTDLQCNNNDLTTLNVTGCTALKELRCYENANLASISGLADCRAITILRCSNCALTDLPGLNTMTNLQMLYASDNQLTSITLTYKANLSGVTLQNNPQLTTADIYNNSRLSSINIRDCTALTRLICYSNALNTLIVEGNTAMTSLYCYDNQLSKLNVEGCTALNALHCYKNKISGSGMTTLVNSLPTRTASNRGHLYVMYNTDENNSITPAQITTAQNKHWGVWQYYGFAWGEMTATERGDVNGDGQVKIDDVTALINLLLSGNTPPSTADCNIDARVNISDVTALINYLLSGTWN